ncbi:ABC transporter substrate-binding protein [Paenibacillus nasutitermitis]|uniref:Bicyclomycin resistance protein n=1 Tax=Paenibacillus nasutitermitis TaxID=1652958 RepID=A0A917DPP1_9BACL|nr:sugar ABC transporter substrate-binding protein [Paenibacillus nasutitermitis]GGD58070.1 bicyclomycin resistance protein [Paenibacillus nasutitermitis]
MGKKIGYTGFIVLLMLALAACSSTDKGGGASPDVPASKNEAKDKGDKVKLTFWSVDRTDADYTREQIAKFEADNPGIEIDYVVKTEEYNQAIDLAFASAQSPDLFRVKENTIQTFYKKGYLEPLDDYVSSEFKSRFTPLKDLNLFDGKMYSFPNYGYTMRLVYNVDLFEKAGINKPPSTLQEMVETAKKLTAVGKADGTYGFALNFKNPASAFDRSARAIAELNGYGGYGFDFKTGRFDVSGFKPIVEAFHQMYNDGSTLPGMESLDIDPLRAQFAEGKIGMYISFSSEPSVYKNQFPAKINWAAAQVPTFDGTVRGASGFLGGQWLSISKESKHKEEAAKFLNFMYGDQILLDYHEKGFAFSMVSSVLSKAKQADIPGIEGFAPTKYDGAWPVQPTVAVQGEKYQDAFFKYMIQGGDLDKIIADLNKRYNEALDKAIASGELDVKPDPSFDPKNLQEMYVK